MTTMVAMTLFTPEVMPELDGCPEFLAITHVRHAAIEFCERSKYWREDLTAINAVADTASYTLSPPSAESVISEVLSVKHNGYKLDPTTESELDDESSTWRTDTATDASEWVATERNIVRLVPAPAASGTANIEVKAVLKPSRTATTLPQPLYDHYLEHVAAGAKARLMAMPDQPWSNPAMSEYYAGVFESGITKAYPVAAKGYNRAPVRSRIF